MSGQDYYGGGYGGHQHNYNAPPPGQNPYNTSAPTYGAPQQQAPYGSQGYPPPQQQPPYGQSQSQQYPPQQAPYGSAPQPYGDNRSGNAPYPPQGQPQYGQGPEGAPGPNGERGLGATLIGGGAGGFVGHEMGGGVIGTVLGSVVGAIGANALEHQHKKHKEEKLHEQQGYLQPQGHYGSEYASEYASEHYHHKHGHHSRHGSRSRSHSRERY